MATSGTSSYTQTKNELILDAFRLVGIYGHGRTVSDEDMNFASNMLNKMVKAWQAQGLHLWSTEEAYIFLSKDTNQYTLGNGSSDARIALASDTVLTKIGADEAAAQTSITVEDSTGMTAADIIGVVLDDRTVHYTTILSVTNPTTIVLSSALPSGASANNNVYSFTQRIDKPLRITSIRRKSTVGTNSSSMMLNQLSRQDYFDLPNRQSSGTPINYHYNPDINTGNLYIWPAPESGKIYLEATIERKLEDITADGDTLDFPDEWLECITYQLASRLGPAFGRTDRSIELVVAQAADMLRLMKEWDGEVDSIKLIPEPY